MYESMVELVLRMGTSVEEGVVRQFWMVTVSARSVGVEVAR